MDDAESLALAAAIVAGDRDTILLGGEPFYTHGPKRCVGRACCVHSPSSHHMASWPMRWWSQEKVMVRVCPHGYGHPDPDDLSWGREVFPAAYAVLRAAHPCDGCCEDATGGGRG